MTHYPDDDWERVDPAEAGLDPDRLDEAVAYAQDHETPEEQVARDFSNHEARHADEGEHAEIIGPMPDERGDHNGLVLREGRVVAEWGPTGEVQHSFSVAKSALSALAGLLYDRDLIHDVDDRVSRYVHDGGFDSPHNAEITWRHLLQGTSEWEGTLFEKPDTVDRGPLGGGPVERDLQEPGAYWEYNDVRVNRLALCLLRMWTLDLPDIFQREVMGPIDASEAWEWHGYHNSGVPLLGTEAESVSGGGHWGGGLWISTRDLARFGHLYCQRGTWDGEAILSEEWIDMTTEPCEVKPTYGFLWWLNTGRDLWPGAPESSFAAVGHGSNLVWVDPEHDLVAVVRWLESDDGDAFPVQDGFLSRLADAVE